MEQKCFVLNRGSFSDKLPGDDISVDTEAVGNNSSSTAEYSTHWCGIGRRKKRCKMLKVTKKPKEVFFKRSSNQLSCSSVGTNDSVDNMTQEDRMVLFNTSENNSTPTDLTHACPRDQRSAQFRRNRGTEHPPVNACTGGCNKGLVNDPDTRVLMKCCVRNTVDQVAQMHIKGADCRSENPYAALRTDTFKKLLKSNRRRACKAKKSGKKIKLCQPKTDECDGIKLQLCPNLGEGHTHEKLIAEVTPLLMRTARSLECQLREVCRRLFFMKNNVPQMTAPTLINFQAILAAITRMLIRDFASFPIGLRLPSRKER